MEKIKYDENIKTPLCEIMYRNKSDKGNINLVHNNHNYTNFYYEIFKNIKFNNLKIFELGLGTNNENILSSMGRDGRPGASLYGWTEFFINSKIYGADIDSDILFNTDNIKTFFCDQTNPEIIKNMWNNNLLDGLFDIIIDDGLHTFKANECFFENSIHKLNKNGYYIIEDIREVDFELFINKIEEWKIKYPYLSFRFIDLEISNGKNSDNNILLIRYI